MDLGIRGKTALVTASSGGMGRNIASALAAEGTNLVLFARSADKLQAAADDISREHGVHASAVPGSMLVAEDVERMVVSATARFGGIDIVILVTGRPPNPIRTTLDENEQGRWDEAYQNQLWSAINVIRNVVPPMMQRRWGRIVAITSASVKQPMPHHALSTVFRAGVTAYMKHLANEVAPHGITVNCVAPALIDTSHRAGASAYTEAQAEARRRMAPMGRMGTQEEMAGVVTFLTSMQAGFVTGSTVNVEGGMIGTLL